MEIYDNGEDADGDSDGGIEVEDGDDDGKEESVSPANGAGSSTGTCTVLFWALHSCQCTILHVYSKAYTVVQIVCYCFP